MIFKKVMLTILLSIVALAVLVATSLVLFEFYLIRQDNKFHEKYLSIAKGATLQEIESVLGPPRHDRPPIESVGAFWDWEQIPESEQKTITQTLVYRARAWYVITPVWEIGLDQNNKAAAKHCYD